jgi:hypothetical protein
MVAECVSMEDLLKEAYFGGYSMLVNSHYIFALPEEEASLLKWRMFWDKSPGVILVCNCTRKFGPGIARVQSCQKAIACCNYTKTERLPLALPARVELEVGGGGAGHTVGVKTPRLTSQAPGLVCQLDLSFAVHAVCVCVCDLPELNSE